MFKSIYTLLLVTATIGMSFSASSQKSKNLVYVDKKGILRYVANNTEAAFFGTNYTIPFAYGYRAHNALNVDIEEAIRNDVYHFARLGFDAFRVHVWDTEITDTSGNLLDNEHLRLFDFLLAELKKRNIKTIITPIAFWGNGYPEKDELTPGFAAKYGKLGCTTNDTAIRSQENYLKQFFTHVNPYTKFTYGNDPDIIAVELNNEPSHTNPAIAVTNYINRLETALESTGWTKPVFYNISQNPGLAKAVVNSTVNGFSFQWYPSGLVGNLSLKGNYLPYVDKYTIPYRDTIPAFANKALIVYEFDAADILQPVMYPMMAKSFKQAGFQWATQFAYDPLAIAYANTEYQTHYLNLAYTSQKAISMLIASKVFHKLPAMKNFGVYPADSVFDVFRVSYKEQLSEMNSETEFYYSNNTKEQPANVSKLLHIAGVGSSPIVQYNGSGAYFLDKLNDGVWRLEIMPDAIHIRDPFERASPKKEVTRIEWKSNLFTFFINDLGRNFDIKGLNEGNTYTAASSDGSFSITPGTYLITKKDVSNVNTKFPLQSIGLNEFVAPKPFSNEMYMRHEPNVEVTAGKPFNITAQIVGVDTGTVTLFINTLDWKYKHIQMQKVTANEYTAKVPADIVEPGILQYTIVLQKGNDYVTFPGNRKGYPWAWDNYNAETYETYVSAKNSSLEIFNPAKDRNIKMYPLYRRNFQTNYITGNNPNSLFIKLLSTDLSSDKVMGFQYTFLDKLKGRITEASEFEKVIIRARTDNKKSVAAKISLIDNNGQPFSAIITLTDKWNDIIISLSDFKPGSALLLPHSYPEFQRLIYAPSPGENVALKVSELEKVEISMGADLTNEELKTKNSFEVESIRLQKN